MTRPSTDQIIEALASDAQPVRPLPSPHWRALTALALIGLFGGLAILFLSDVPQLLSRYAGREEVMTLEMAAMLATGILAVLGAFIVSIPGRSRRWLLAPLPPFLLWLLLSGLGCYEELLRSGSSGWEVGHSMDCLLFIVATSLGIGVPLTWRLARAAPIEPLPVALLGGLGSAALAAFLLQFFHPFAVTFIDLAVHLLAVLLVIGAAAILNRRTLSPA